jgi:hypothetical protein
MRKLLQDSPFIRQSRYFAEVSPLRFSYVVREYSVQGRDDHNDVSNKSSYQPEKKEDRQTRRNPKDRNEDH